MKLDESGRYGIEDMERGKALLAALSRSTPGAVEAARSAIAAHLDDAATAAIVRVGEDLRAVPQYTTYGAFHRAELGAARVAARTQDERSASRRRITDENERRRQRPHHHTVHDNHGDAERAPEMSESAKARHRERVRQRADRHASALQARVPIAGKAPPVIPVN